MYITLLDSLQSYMLIFLLCFYFGNFINNARKWIVSLILIALVKTSLKEIGDQIYLYTLIFSNVYLLYKLYTRKPIYLITIGLMVLAEMIVCVW